MALTLPETIHLDKVTAAVAAGSSGGTMTSFSPELMARVAMFAHPSDSELMSICLAVGPIISRLIKHDYLQNNTQYLERTLKVFLNNCRFFNRKDEKSELARCCRKAGENHMAWMTINCDWKANVKDNLMEELKLATMQGSILRFTFHPYVAFNNPAVAIQFGLMDVLKYLVEEKVININALRWSPFTSTPTSDETPVSLLRYSMGLGHCSKQIEIYKYLLGRDDVNFVGGHANPKLSIFPQAVESGDDDLLRLLIDHPRFGVNSCVASWWGGYQFVTPLVRVISYSHGSGLWSDYDWFLRVLRMLVEAGADPTLVCPNYGLSPLEHARKCRARGVNPAWEEKWNAAIRVLEGEEPPAHL